MRYMKIFWMSLIKVNYMCIKKIFFNTYILYIMTKSVGTLEVQCGGNNSE